LQVIEGRYGPYVTDGELNASVPRGADPATLSLDEARALLEARRGAPPSARRGRRAARGPAARGRSRVPRLVDEAVASPQRPNTKTKPKAAGRKRTVRKRAS
jgi:DNA topoisomerase-1